LTEYERLLECARNDNLTVIESYDFSGTRIDGLYCDGTVALSKDLHTDAERICIMQEELGHHYTSSGNIINQHLVPNRKQEHRARLWAYNKLIGLRGIVSAYKAGCSNSYEMAYHLEVTEEFLLQALSCYRQKYGVYAQIDNYVIYFEPAIAVFELI